MAVELAAPVALVVWAEEVLVHKQAQLPEEQLTQVAVAVVEQVQFLAAQVALAGQELSFCLSRPQTIREPQPARPQ